MAGFAEEVLGGLNERYNRDYKKETVDENMKDRACLVKSGNAPVLPKEDEDWKYS